MNGFHALCVDGAKGKALRAFQSLSGADLTLKESQNNMIKAFDKSPTYKDIREIYHLSRVSPEATISGITHLQAWKDLCEANPFNKDTLEKAETVNGRPREHESLGLKVPAQYSRDCVGIKRIGDL